MWMRSVIGTVLAVVTIAAGCAPAGPSPAVAGPWKAVAAAPVSLTEVAVTARAGRIWVAGGLRADGSATDEVFVFDPAAGTWTPAPRLPEAIHHSALVSTDDGLVLVGGYTASGAPTAAVRRLVDGAAAWTDDLALPDARGAGAAAFDGTRIVYAGGVKPGGVASEVYARRGEGAWETIGRLPLAREHLAATSDGAGKTFVLGGRVGGLEANMATVDLVEGSGIRTLGDVPTKRGGVAAFWSPSLGACLAGGESPGGTNRQVECMNATGSVSRLPDLEVGRHGVGAAVVDGRAYVVLGGRRPGLFVSDVTESLQLP